MTFTSTPPTRPGFYAWNQHIGFDPIPKHVWEDEKTKRLWTTTCAYQTVPVSVIDGYWCLLVPAEEVEKAFREGITMALGTEEELTAQLWLTSNARKVVEGEK